MLRYYEAPALEPYGTLETLTGSFKCTLGVDGIYKCPESKAESQWFSDRYYAGEDCRFQTEDDKCPAP